MVPSKKAARRRPLVIRGDACQKLPWQCLNLRPEPQGQGAFLSEDIFESYNGKLR